MARAVQRISRAEAEACVLEAFRDAFGRDPTPAETRRWANTLRRGMAPATMRAALADSEEFRRRDPVDDLKAAVLATGLFDADWYLATYRDVARAGFDPLDHYCRHGRLEHRAPNAWFDDAWYRQRAGIADDIDALLDYAGRGDALGIPPGPKFDPAAYRIRHGLRDDTAALAHALRHPEAIPVTDPATERDLFDPAWYLATYRDVASAGHDPVEHFFRHGRAENRAPNAYFDPVWYRQRCGLPADIDPLHDYLQRGDAQGVPPGPNFDPRWYRAAFALGDAENALAHFLRHRMDGQVAPCARLWSLTHRAPARTDPFVAFLTASDDPVQAAAADIALLQDSALFDANFYQVTNEDVFNAGIEPLAHFCAFGWKENRNPNFYFNLSWYTATNPEVQRLQVNPLVHYRLVGEAADRRPVVYFEPGWYRRTYGLAQDQSPLAHYLAHRRSQEFSPNSLFDPAWYMAHCGEKLHPRRDVFAHYLVAGMQKDVAPSQHFDAAAWRRRTRGRATRRFRYTQSPAKDNPLVNYMLANYR